MPAGKSCRTSRSMPEARCGGPDDAQRLGVVRLQDARVLEAGCTDSDCPTAACAAPPTSRRAGFSRSIRLAAIAGSMSNVTPPGRTRPRPKRLPQIAPVAFRKSPRSRPQ